jgi:hypothetical protein
LASLMYSPLQDDTASEVSDSEIDAITAGMAALGTGVRGPRKRALIVGCSYRCVLKIPWPARGPAQTVSAAHAWQPCYHDAVNTHLPFSLILQRH